MSMRILIAGAVLSLSLVSLAQAAPVTLTADLSGKNEVSGGDEKATGTASVVIDVDAKTVKWTITTKDLADPVAAHIHSGAAGANGGVVVNFGKDLTGSLSDQSADALKGIVEKPGDFYVNVHSKTNPGGAARGQLKK